MQQAGRQANRHALLMNPALLGNNLTFCRSASCMQCTWVDVFIKVIVVTTAVGSDDNRSVTLDKSPYFYNCIDDKREKGRTIT